MGSRALALALLLGVANAQGVPVSWNTWALPGAGTILTDSGPVGVAFVGDSPGIVLDYPSCLPASSWADDAKVFNAPISTNNMLKLIGGSPAIQTLTFSVPVQNPVLAIWSLGSPSALASFNFVNATPILVSGGKNNEYGGGAITVSGNTVTGLEGNGTVQFQGTYTSLSWINPLHENWYGLNVGLPAVSSAWTITGAGLKGTNGTPTLVAAGPLAPFSPGALTLGSAKPFTGSMLFVSPISVPAPFQCGTLIAFPPALQWAVTTTWSGAYQIPWPAWPPGLSGVTFYCQYAFVDPAADCGISLSNGLRADVP